MVNSELYCPRLYINGIIWQKLLICNTKIYIFIYFMQKDIFALISKSLIIITNHGKEKRNKSIITNSNEPIIIKNH